MHELSVSKLIAAPRAVVWDVLVNRQAQWWCPTPWRAEPGLQERHPGGRCEMVMHGPNGEVMPHRGIYLAWDEGRRFAVTDAVVGDLEPAGPMMIGIWELSDQEGGTLYTARARHWTAQSMEQHRDMGFTAGWQACAEQLAALCEG